MTESDEINKEVDKAYINEDLDIEEIKEKYEMSKKRIQETKEKRRLKKETTKSSEYPLRSDITQSNEDSKSNKKEEKTRSPMKNITINYPDIYDEKIQWLIDNKFIVSRSEAVRTAIREFLQREYNHNLELLDYFKFKNKIEIKKNLEKEV